MGIGIGRDKLGLVTKISVTKNLGKDYENFIP